MENKVDILGFLIDKYYVDEMLELVRSQWNERGLLTYGLVTMNLLMAAKEDEVLANYIQSLNLSIIGEPEVLKAAKIEDESMLQEVANHEFLGAFFMYVIEYGNTVFVLGETKEETEILKKHLEETYEGLKIVASDALCGEGADGSDRVINEINSVSPEVILTCSQSHNMERFAVENRKKVNARIWMSLGSHANLQAESGLKSNWLSKLLEKSTFKKMVARYNSEKGE